MFNVNEFTYDIVCICLAQYFYRILQTNNITLINIKLVVKVILTLMGKTCLCNIAFQYGSLGMKMLPYILF